MFGELLLGQVDAAWIVDTVSVTAVDGGPRIFWPICGMLRLVTSVPSTMCSRSPTKISPLLAAGPWMTPMRPPQYHSETVPT